jgi:hypothetical protein
MSPSLPTSWSHAIAAALAFNLDDEGTFTAAFGGFLLLTAAAIRA